MSEAAKHNYDITYDTVDIKIKKRQAPIISPSDNVPSDIPGGRPVNKSNPEVLTETEGPNGVINSIVRDKIIVSPSKNKVITKDDIQRGLTREQWDKLVESAQMFSCECCKSLNNYISKEFGEKLKIED